MLRGQAVTWMSLTAFLLIDEGACDYFRLHVSVALRCSVVLGKRVPSFLKSLPSEHHGSVIYVFNFVQLGEIKDIQKLCKPSDRTL